MQSIFKSDFVIERLRALNLFTAKGSKTKPPTKNLDKVICKGLKSLVTVFRLISIELKNKVVSII